MQTEVLTHRSSQKIHSIPQVSYSLKKDLKISGTRWKTDTKEVGKQSLNATKEKPVTFEDFAQVMRDVDLDFDGKKKIVASAVSGGADSMGLTLLLKEWCKQNDIHLVAVTVDHALREESMKEALQVQKWLQAQNIEHHILTAKWDSKPSPGKLLMKARDLRYKLLENLCEQLGISYLFTAHQQDDQIETFILRLAHSSGTDGLAGIPLVNTFSKMTIVRPLLGFSKERMKATCQALKQEWIEDPTNQDLLYQRNRIRNTLQEVYKMVPRKDFMAVIQDMGDARTQYEHIVSQFIREHVHASYSHGYCKVRIAEFSRLSEGVALRVLRRLIRFVKGEFYPLSLPHLQGLARDLLSLNPTMDVAYDASGIEKKTLAGCLFQVGYKWFWVVKERGNLTKVNIPTIKLGQTVTWQNRFQISLLPEPNCPQPPPITEAKIGTLPVKDWGWYVNKMNLRVNHRFPTIVRQSLPVIFDMQDNVVALPALGYVAVPGIRVEAKFVPPFPLIPDPDSLEVFQQ